jgi:mono/diheme cytochrome c family protein
MDFYLVTGRLCPSIRFPVSTNAQEISAAMRAIANLMFIVLGCLLQIGGTPVTAAEAETAAERGYRILTKKAFGKPVLTEADFDQLWNVWPEELRSKAEHASEQERREMAFERYGLVPNPDREDGLPLAVVRDEQGRWGTNCLQCHGGQVAGQIIPGLGNAEYAMQTLTEDFANLRRFKAGQKLRKSTASFFSQGNSNGTTNAQVFSIVLSAVRDNELNIASERKQMKFENHDLDAPPFWNVKKKKNLYIDGFVPKTPRVIMQFVMSNPPEELKSWESDFRDILAWIDSVEAPKYPWNIDQRLAEQGRMAFEDHCSQCHGTYGPDGEYPELMVEIEEVGTDPVRLTGMPPEHRRFYSESWFGEFGKLEVVENPEGYIAPPLDGIWASAPYLHNGSVPTLWHLFYPESRPKIWLRDSKGYDQERVGLQVTEFDQLPSRARQRADERRRYFDTTMKSKSAQGHLFPDELTADEKKSVLEYLKTL